MRPGRKSGEVSERARSGIMVTAQTGTMNRRRLQKGRARAMRAPGADSGNIPLAAAAPTPGSAIRPAGGGGAGAGPGLNRRRA